METKQIETLSFIDKVKEFKNGNKDALDSIFQVVIDKKKHGISKILINDNELVKNYSNIMNKYKGVIPYDELNQLFHIGLMESIYKIKACNSNQEVLAFVQRGIINKIRRYKKKYQQEKVFRVKDGLTKSERLHNAEIEKRQRDNKYTFKYTNKKSDDYIASDSFDKFSNAETKREFGDQASFEQYSHDDSPSQSSEFMRYCPIKKLLTKAQLRVWNELLKVPDPKSLTDAEIGKILNMTQQNVNQLRKEIYERLNDCFDVFLQLNRHDTTRLTSEVIDFLDHIHKLKQYYDFADDDERLFLEVFDFIKKQYAYIDQSESNIHKLFKNKHTYETTIDNLLSENWTAQNKPSVSAQKALSKLEKAVEKNDIKSINKRDRERMLKHIIAAMERYLVKFKADIEENAKINRIKRDKEKEN